ncbi:MULTISPECIES: hypothetical protein [Bradyrhizobium]|uniref:hypothetical protein n=1 Tax=Bradyrhizobium TaxID=374 RepID=UPI0011AEC33B|nr:MULTISPECIES: hypothetical protein [Bradyrhizobium]
MTITGDHCCVTTRKPTADRQAPPIVPHCRLQASQASVSSALLNQMKKRDWAFVAACVSGAVLFGVWSFQIGNAFHRSQETATDRSSLRRSGPDDALAKPSGQPR